MTLSHFLAREILQRDSLLTKQFVANIIGGHDQQLELVEILDGRSNLQQLGIDPAKAEAVKTQFYDHLKFLPDVLHVNVYAMDRKIIWASNATLIGKVIDADDELEEAISTRVMVTKDYLNQEHHNELEHKLEQLFAENPQAFFVENYIPLLDKNGSVIAVAEIYKEPKSLMDTIKRGYLLVWASTALGVVLLYLAMLWIIRRADQTVEEQQKQIIESESLCILGEMSAAVAHGIRKPLTSIRTSAELALELDPGSKSGRYAVDIMTQTDRLDKWIRELLETSRPLESPSESIDMNPLIAECLPYLAGMLDKNKVVCNFIHPTHNLPPVIGNRTLITQALISVLSNAIEAMPKGGKLEIQLQYLQKKRQVEIIVSDTGQGLSKDQLGCLFKPFYTTKNNGIGLGMAQIKSMMKRFGAAITMTSEAQKGTSVTLSFMVADKL
ncbi:MAG: GHKL domain-containing protein [Gallionella sp.]|nr:GHKL domain-containing protein [Gallionella sp.]